MPPLRLLALAPLALAACASQPEDAPSAARAATSSDVAPARPAAATSAGAFPFDLGRPATTHALPAALREVSGVAVLPDGRLAAVQDEAGVLYTLDAATGRIVGEHTFGPAGDYEAVEWADGAVWVLEADGTLHEIPGGTGAATVHDTPLKKKCDAEGLAYDRAEGRLLVACKEDPGDGLDEDAHKAIYAFDLGTRRLDERPAFVLERAALDADEEFKPSALAVHPRTGQLYVLSSVRNALAVVERDGRLAAVAALPEAGNPQPEGLAFAPDGTLYLANEGPEGAGTVATYAARP